MRDILENALIEDLTRGMPRHPQQVSGLQESDAELLRLPGLDSLLALTTDSLAEELGMGLYRDPYLIGWMTVTVNASDLAAVGAEPIGILVNETIPADADNDFRIALQQGIRDACEALALHLLGGDTNFSSNIHMSATALGVLNKGRPMTRLGCQPGDALYASGPLGLGSAFALLHFRADPQPHGQREIFKPNARLREGQLARPFATACMDTSDGVIPTLDQLMHLNDIGLRLTTPLEEMLHQSALDVAHSVGIPDWLLLAGPHGEFELLFTVPQDMRQLFAMAAAKAAWEPIEIGEVVAEPVITIPIGGVNQQIDTTAIRNLFHEVRGDVTRYIAGLLNLDHTIVAAT
jgi:thiamine-monophosphate kinase